MFSVIFVVFSQGMWCGWKLKVMIIVFVGIINLLLGIGVGWCFFLVFGVFSLVCKKCILLICLFLFSLSVIGWMLNLKSVFFLWVFLIFFFEFGMLVLFC